jgi:hypothetical protein
MLSLPSLCLDNIAEQLCVLDGHSSETLRTAIVLSKTSSECNKVLSSYIYNFLDPMCIEDLDKQRIKRAGDMIVLNTHVALAEANANEPGTYNSLSLAELKQECIVNGCAKTGTKSKLVENLVNMIEFRSCQAKSILSQLRKIPSKMNPLRSNVRALLHHSTSMDRVTVSVLGAKQLGASELVLNELYQKNNLTISQSRLMLFVKSDVLKMIAKLDGPGTNYIQDAEAMLLVLTKNEKNKAAKYKKTQARSVQLDQFLLGFGVYRGNIT